MTRSTMLAGTVSAELNFAAERTTDGIWSNLTPEIRTQRLAAHPVDLRDARDLSPPASLDREGFIIVRHPLDRPGWRDPAWVDAVYAPACLDLVRRLTGAAHVALFTPGILIRDTGDPAAAPAADFVHYDNTREAALQFLDRVTDAETRRRYPRTRIFNVWRALTPPPQDVPLALCDQRCSDPDDWVIGRTVEPNYPQGVPYVSAMANPAQRWFWFRDVRADEAIVFKGYDSDPEEPFGCLHGAFRHPDPGAATVPRASAELRGFALSES